MRNISVKEMLPSLVCYKSKKTEKVSSILNGRKKKTGGQYGKDKIYFGSGYRATS